MSDYFSYCFLSLLDQKAFSLCGLVAYTYSISNLHECIFLTVVSVDAL